MLKQLCCPRCGAAQSLNCHSKLYGNDPESATGEPTLRGQRVWCCPRGQRGGCGKSFSIFLAEVMPRHTLRASTLWSLLERLLAGGSISRAAKGLAAPFVLESLYHLLRRTRLRLAAVRSALCQECPAPASSQTDPLLQSVEHLRQAFPRSGCPCADFQLRFQRLLLE